MKIYYKIFVLSNSLPSKEKSQKAKAAAAKKAALNSKGEKKGDLLDVITSIGDKTNDLVKQVNDVTDDVEKLTLNKRAEEVLPESTNNHVRDSVSPSDEVAPKVNGVSEAKHDSDLEEGEIIEEEEEKVGSRIRRRLSAN